MPNLRVYEVDYYKMIEYIMFSLIKHVYDVIANGMIFKVKNAKEWIHLAQIAINKTDTLFDNHR